MLVYNVQYSPNKRTISHSAHVGIFIACVCDVVISVLIFSNLIETVYVIKIFLDRETSPPMIQTPYGNRFFFLW